jgi:RNA polymerase sigma factor (sigma-70 family)
VKQSRIENILLCLSSDQVDAAWVAFLDAYSGTLRHVVSQFESTDFAADDCFEFICARLSDDNFRRLKLFNPEGPAHFKTWLTVVAANLCIDWRRSVYGRQRPPRFVIDLPELEQLVFKYLYKQGMTRHECLHVLKARYPKLDAADIAQINKKLYESLSSTQRWQAGVKRNDTVPAEDREELVQESAMGPDARTEYARDRAKLEKALSRLDPDERLLLQLRYQQDLTLAEVARLTGYDDPFKARRAIDKALASLRKIFDI